MKNIPDRFLENKTYGWLDNFFSDVRVSAYWSIIAGCAGLYLRLPNDIWQMYDVQ